MANLYELTRDYRNLMAMADDPDVDEEIFKDTLEGLDGAIEVKADGYAAVIRNLEVTIGGLEGQAKVIQEELDRIKERKKSLENRIASMKEDLCNAMIACDKRKFDTSRFKFWVQKTTPSLVIDDPANIPMTFYKVPKPQIDNAAIKEALINGDKLEFAHLEQKDGVRFK